MKLYRMFAEIIKNKKYYMKPFEKILFDVQNDNNIFMNRIFINEALNKQIILISVEILLEQDLNQS